MNFLITAGPTREAIDPVRFISNRSSGKMGYAIARAAIEAGHEVVLISGPVCVPRPATARIIDVITGDEMFEAAQNEMENADVFVMCAAVCDFKPAEFSPHKIKKNNAATQLALIPTRDILSLLSRPQKKIVYVGFAAETESLAAHAQKKLREKKCDLIIGNDVSRMDAGLESDDNELHLYFKDGEERMFPRESKDALAKKLVKVLAQLAKSC